jgi:hypothetical protein
MAMNPKLLRPKASGVHPEAAAWKTAVVANGGSVSGTTLSAVDKFCKAIDTAGIRDRFYRLNLFCGTGLNACLVPLYRGPSRSGTQYGNTTDTNLNFVSGDYTETGSTGGLNSGSNSTKYLRPGIAPSDIAATPWNNHVAVYSRDLMATNSQFIGANSYSFFPGYSAGTRVYYRTVGSNSGLEGTLTTGSGHLVAVRTSATVAALYRNGSAVSSTATDNGTTAADTNKLIIFGQGTTTETPAAYFSGRIQAYSLGVSMTASQASSYYTALQTLQTTLGRNL